MTPSNPPTAFILRSPLTLRRVQEQVLLGWISSVSWSLSWITGNILAKSLARLELIALKGITCSARDGFLPQQRVRNS
jgi:hypothetical protein